VTNLLGYQPEQLAGTFALDLVHPHDQEQFKILYQRRPGEKEQIAEYRFKTAGGEWLWLESVVSNKLHDPEVQGLVINARNITERKLAQLTMLENKQRYKALFENNPDPVLFENTSGLITDANAPLLRNLNTS